MLNALLRGSVTLGHPFVVDRAIVLSFLRFILKFLLKESILSDVEFMKRLYCCSSKVAFGVSYMYVVLV